MSPNTIKNAFEFAESENRPALLSYTVAGDNSKSNSLKILKSLSKYVDICELGFPHNTPIADGGQIQTSSYRSLKNGTKIKDVFNIVKMFKKGKLSKPIILMGYYNIIFQYGESKFIKMCKASGVDGIIVVDLPWPENINFSKLCKKNYIEFVQLISPTTSTSRAKKIIKSSHSMIYYISMLSTTGGRLKTTPKEIKNNYLKIKKLSKKKNCVIGFGITKDNIASFKTVDGLVVGSQICREISNSIKNKQKITKNVDKLAKILKRRII